MSIVLRFVDKEGYVQERFFGLVHVRDTKASTLKEGIFSVLAQYNLDVKCIRGKGYDGASNMRGEFNGLQALVSKACPQAYYIHCFAHRLQLALVSAAKDVGHVYHFFNNVSFIINIASASSKRNDQLKAAHASNIEFLVSIGELDSGSGLNQLGSLSRPGDTRWSSHLKSIYSLMTMYSATCEVLLGMIHGQEHRNVQADTGLAYHELMSIKFVFILHIMKAILEISNSLCQALQRKNQDILNAMSVVAATKHALQKLRDDGWDLIVQDVRKFCEKVSLEFPDMTSKYVPKRGQPRRSENDDTLEHFYRFDVFYAAIDCQREEMDCRFSDNTMELIRLSTALDPREMGKTFRVDDICKLVEKFYPTDFEAYDMLRLRSDIVGFDYYRQLPEFKELITLSDLCRWMKLTGKSDSYPLLYRVVTLVLTLPVSTATTERSFSCMSIIKTARRNRMEDEFLCDSLLVYIEKEIVMQFTLDEIVDDFRDMAERRSQF